LPKDFCNYKLETVKSYDFVPGTKLASAFELTFSDGTQFYECFDGLFATVYETRQIIEAEYSALYSPTFIEPLDFASNWAQAII